MQQYETRLTSRGALSLFVFDTYFSDAAAIRAAKNLWKHGEAIEVWRGDVCVFADAHREVAVLPWPISLPPGHEPINPTGN